MTVLTVGLDDADERLDEARALRARGERFVCRFVVPPPRPVRVLRAAAESLAHSDPGTRRDAIERLGVVEEIPPSPGSSGEGSGRRSAIFAEIAELSDGAIGYTHEERRIVDMVLERTRAGCLPTRLVTPQPSPLVPARVEPARDADALVLWAPHEEAWIASLAVYALQSQAVPLIVVCRGDALPNVRADFVAPADAPAALARARGVIDLSLHDPGEALALAALGLPLAVSYLSGAYELLDNVAIYRPWVERDIVLAAAMLPALGAPAARTRGAPAGPAARVHAFGGAVARRWAADARFERTTIVADAGSALDALDGAVRLRRTGERFDVAFALDESYTTTQLDVKATLRDLALLGEALVTRSWADLRRAFLSYDLIKRDFSVVGTQDPRVPPPRPRAPGTSLLIWAPDHDPVAIASVLAGAIESGRPVLAVCGEGDLPRGVTRVAADAASRALQECAVCVAAAPTDPSAAFALARWDLPLCAPLTNGAQEWLDGVHAYRPWSVPSVRAAVDAALRNDGAPVAAEVHDVRAAEAALPWSASRVCVIVRARGSERWRLATDAAFERQAHPALETVFAGSAAEVRTALERSTHDYVAFVDEGDIPYPECFAALAVALDRSNAAFAYGDALLAYVVPGRGEPCVLGYSVVERDALVREKLLAQDALAGTYFRVMFRRGALVANGGLAEDFDALAVLEATVRMCAAGAGAYVDRVLGMAHRHLDGTSPAYAPVGLCDEYRRFHARYAVDDARSAKLRDAVLEHLSVHPAIPLRPPPLRLHPPTPVFAGA